MTSFISFLLNVKLCPRQHLNFTGIDFYMLDVLAVAEPKATNADSTKFSYILRFLLL